LTYGSVDHLRFGLRGNRKIDPILETLCFADGTQIVLTKLTDGKFEVTSNSWDKGKVILPDQILEIRLVDGRIRIARKEKRRDMGDLQQRPEPTPAEGEFTEFLDA